MYILTVGPYTNDMYIITAIYFKISGSFVSWLTFSYLFKKKKINKQKSKINKKEKIKKIKKISSQA